MKIIITGATGMVGEGVLLTALKHPDVEKVLIINRRPSEITHPKLTEIVHSDFFNLSSVADRLTGFDACFFCLGVSSIGLKEPEYFKMTYTLTLHAAELMAKASPGMTFIYVSGKGTDSSEKGGSMWARVKGKTENDLMKLPFKAVFAFRPGFMKAVKGQKRLLSAYKYFAWMYAPGRLLAPGAFCKLEEVAYAMIKVSRNGYPKKVIEVRDMVAIAAGKPV